MDQEGPPVHPPHSPVTGLAVALGQTTLDDDKPLAVAVHPRAPREPLAAKAPGGSTPRYLWCGLLQASVALAYGYLTASALDRGLSWLDQAADVRTVYVRAVEFSRRPCW